MRKYHNGPYKVRCGFCGAVGHNIRSCPHIEEAASDKDGAKWDRSHVIIAQAELEKRDSLKKKAVIRKKKSHCGFCGGRKHNRKNCNKMKRMKKEILAANRKWRATFVERVNTLGIAAGALVETSGVPVHIFGSNFVLGKDPKRRYVGVVNPFDFDSLSFFCNFRGNYEYRSLADVSVKVTTESGYIDISVGSFIGEDIFYKSAYFRYYNKIKVIVPSKLSDKTEWIKDTDMPEIDWLLRNHSLDDLKELGLTNHIEKWS